MIGPAIHLEHVRTEKSSWPEMKELHGLPVVSVVVPVWNSAPFLGECIDNLLEQHFRSFEIILADDGSTDGSRKIAERFLRTYPDRIRWFEHPRSLHRGVSATRNLGIRFARGRTIAFQDTDDLWEPDKLTEQIRIMEKHDPLGLVCTGHRVTMWRDRTPYPETKILPAECRDRPINALDLLLQDNPIATPTVVVPRRTLISIGGFERRFRTEAEDWITWIKIAALHPVYFLSRPLATLRVRSGGLSNRSYDRGMVATEEFRMLDSLHTFLNARGEHGGAEDYAGVLKETLIRHSAHLSLESGTRATRWRFAAGLMRLGPGSARYPPARTAWLRMVMALLM